MDTWIDACKLKEFYDENTEENAKLQPIIENFSRNAKRKYEFVVELYERRHLAAKARIPPELRVLGDLYDELQESRQGEILREALYIHGQKRCGLSIDRINALLCSFAWLVIKRVVSAAAPPENSP